jgi:hypothetical protein
VLHGKGTPRISPRSAGWAGVLCVAAVAIALFVPGFPLPSAADSAAAVNTYLDAHRAAWMLGAWLTFPELVFFFWFIGGLYAYLRNGAGRSDGLLLFMLAGAVGAVAAGLIATTLQIVLGIVPFADLGPAAVKALYVAWLVSGVPVLFMPLAAMLFAAAEGLRTHPSTPLWLAGLGYAAMLCCILATLTTFFTTGALALNGPIGYITFFVFGAWTILTSIQLIGSVDVT